MSAGDMQPAAVVAPTDLRVWRDARAVQMTEAPRSCKAWRGSDGWGRACRRTPVGAHEHPQGLAGVSLPCDELIAVGDRPIDLLDLSVDWLVVYCFPGVGRDVDSASYLEDVREHRAYRAREDFFLERRVRVAALSGQDTAGQRDAVWAQEVRHHVLRDPGLHVVHSLGLPTIQIGRRRCYSRLTLLARRGVIQHVFYPVDRAAANPNQVRAWMEIHAAG